MNKIDKRLHKALRFLSRYSTLDILDMLTDNKKKFRKYVPKDIDRYLQHEGYMVFQPGATNVLPMKGLQYLKDLEDIRRKERTLIASVIAVIASVIAVIISLVALAKSMGWI